MEVSAKYRRSVDPRRGLATAAVIGVMLHAASARADGDVAAGEHLFDSRCTACHSVNPTRKPGPLLSGVYGGPPGSVPDCHYSAALKGAAITWDAANLDRRLSGPPAFIAGVKMQAQVGSAKDRQDIIAYLKSISPQEMGRRDAVPPG